VLKGSTSVALASSGNPSTAKSPVTVTATITPATATGTVTFYDGGVALGAAMPLSGGTAGLSTSALTAKTHAITCVYNGDANFAGSTAPALSQVVNGLPGTIAVSASPIPSSYGQAVTLSATLSG